MAYEKLAKACGGSISIEALMEFEEAMVEYKKFMGAGREMFAPREEYRYRVNPENECGE